MRVGRYHVYEEFATGGMASVHFGKLFGQGGFQRTVAIKVPHPQFVRDAQARAMILDEARIVASIRSPHVVTTLELIEEHGTVYQVMEYADGPPLSLLRKRGPVPIAIAIAITQGILRGLHAAHEVRDATGRALEVVHRDVSPHNVVVESDGTPKLLDFGIAAAVGKLHLTQPGEVKGKVSYMAPEQVQADPLDRRADVYAVGVVLFELLAGELPFSGADFKTIAVAHVLTPVPDLCAIRDEVPRGLREVVERAMAKERRDRYATALAMAEDLARVEIAPASKEEVGEWVRDVGREFFDARREALAALPREEREESPPVVVAPPRRRSLAPIAGAAAGLAVIGAIVIGPRLFASTPTAPSAAVPSVAVVALVEDAAVEPPPLPPPTSSVVPAPSTTPKNPVRPSAAVAPPPPSVTVAPIPTPSLAPSVAPARPPCCAGEIRIRLRDCIDNCPSGS